jgi:hypothetical protein
LDILNSLLLVISSAATSQIGKDLLTTFLDGLLPSFYNEREKGFLDIGGLKLRAGQNAAEPLPDRFSRRDVFWIECGGP